MSHSICRVLTQKANHTPWQWFCLLCAACCATTAVLVIQGRHMGRAAAVTRTETELSGFGRPLVAQRWHEGRSPE